MAFLEDLLSQMCYCVAIAALSPHYFVCRCDTDTASQSRTALSHSALPNRGSLLPDYSSCVGDSCIGVIILGVLLRIPSTVSIEITISSPPEKQWQKQQRRQQPQAAVTAAPTAAAKGAATGAVTVTTAATGALLVAQISILSTGFLKHIRDWFAHTCWILRCNQLVYQLVYFHKRLACKISVFQAHEWLFLCTQCMWTAGVDLQFRCWPS